MHALWDGGPTPLQIFEAPTSFTGTDGNQHSATVFTSWRAAQLREVGIYPFTRAPGPNYGDEVTSRTYALISGIVVESASMRDTADAVASLKEMWRGRLAAEPRKKMHGRHVYDGVPLVVDLPTRNALSDFYIVARTDDTFTVTMLDADGAATVMNAVQIIRVATAVARRKAELTTALAGNFAALNDLKTADEVRRFIPSWPP